MKNKIKVVNKFIFETVITFLPFTISYLLLGNYLSRVSNYPKGYENDPNFLYEVIIYFRNLNDEGAFTGLQMLASETPWYWYEDLYILPNDLGLHQIDILEVFWIGLILSFLLIIIGRMLALAVMRVIAKRVKIKSVIE
ncbi:hypothetical protein [Ornithinibacillus bavariensis]|uniref:Uncharacterized protein n=1 Tax=Ornithinibacillus bavariensis TaxID=545502 RepID=A0A920C6L5_9BACI|nr:hypothetical protein [Ornithinibacillus bavariensis]GIO28061.1 hypothetical protein J43TS3_26720 [Ornithinibacillus bavariensis]